MTLDGAGLPVETRTTAERALREQNLRDRLEWAGRKVRSGWYRAVLVTAGGPGAFLAASIVVWDGRWPVLAWPVLLWLIFVSGWMWWGLRRDRREKRVLESRLRRLDGKIRRAGSFVETGPHPEDSRTIGRDAMQEER